MVGSAMTAMVFGQTATPRQPDTQRLPSARTEALELKLFKVSQALLQEPQNPELLLQKGAYLSELGRLEAAFEIFELLRLSFPNHPAPYANLASVLARQGKFEEARQMLIKADLLQGNKFQTQLSLAAINLELALVALNKANEINPGDRATESKLRLLEKYIAESSKPTFQQPEPGGANRTVEARPQESASAKMRRTPALSPLRQPGDRLTLAALDADDSAAVSVPPSPLSIANISKRSLDDPRKAQVLKAVDTWATVWSNRSFEAYASLYSMRFQPPEGLSKEAWARKKQTLMEKSTFIQVSQKVRSIKFSGEKATVLLMQKYSSDFHKDHGRKELQFIFEDGQWKILSERIAN